MALDTCVEYMSGQAVPKQFIHIKKHLLQEIPGNASATLHRSVATWWRNNSADREKKAGDFYSSPRTCHQSSAWNSASFSAP